MLKTIVESVVLIIGGMCMIVATGCLVYVLIKCDKIDKK